MPSATVEEHIRRRQNAALLSWRRRELEKDRLKAAKIDFAESSNKGIAAVQTKLGLVRYRLATSAWKAEDGATGKGVQALKTYMESKA